MNKTFILIFLSFFALGCQDHHFVPIEEAGDIKLRLSENTAPPEFSGKPSMSAQKEVMTDAYQMGGRPAKTGKLIAEGELLLGEAQKERDFSEFTVYVIAWPYGGGPSLAVSRYDYTEFPLSFRLDDNSLMAADFPALGEKLKIEARLDRDGDPITKEAGDIYGFAQKPVMVGSGSVSITLDKNRAP